MVWTVLVHLRASQVALVVKKLPADAGNIRCGFNPWVRNSPWRRAWQHTPVFLPGESHGQRSLLGHSPQGHKESDTTEVTWCEDTQPLICRLFSKINTTAVHDLWFESMDQRNLRYKEPTINSTLIFQLCGGLMQVTAMFKGQLQFHIKTPPWSSDYASQT